MRLSASLCAAVSLAAATPALADVHDSSASGFAVRATAVVPAGPEEVWNELLDPADWWDGTHTFSGDASNLSLDPRAGGCFCELLPDAKNKEATPRGGIQHMQVVYIEKPRVLRMTGALGPLQSEAVNGVLTFIIKPDEGGGGTRINAEYVVGGFMRVPGEKMAPLVDGVIGAQVDRLARKLGAAPSAAPEAPTADEPIATDAPTSDQPGSGEAPAPGPAPERAPIIGR